MGGGVERIAKEVGPVMGGLLGSHGDGPGDGKHGNGAGQFARTRDLALLARLEPLPWCRLFCLA
jgi:hypothetical protein